MIPSADEMNRRSWWDDFRNPFNIITLSIGILGIAAAYYFYTKSEAVSEISWTSFKQIVFNYKTATPDITVLDKDGQKINTNLYAIELTIWNSGNTRLDNVDQSTIIREPLSIKILGDGQFKSSSITAANNNGINTLLLSQADKRVVIEWKHLDPSSAFRILLLYTGTDTTEVKPDILMSNGHSIHYITYTQPNRSLNHKLATYLPFGYVSLMISLLTVALMLTKYQRRFRYWLTTCIIAPLLVFIISFAILYEFLKPPFIPDL